MVTWQIINILSLRLDHTSERFTASTSVKISAVDGIVFYPVAMLGRGRPSLSKQQPLEQGALLRAARPARPAGPLSPLHVLSTASRWGRRPPLPSCPWDSSVAQPKFPHPGFELSACVSATASGAAGAPCHQRAVVVEEHSPPSPCPWPSFHLLQRTSPDPLEHSGTSRGFAVAPRNSSTIVMKVCQCHRCAVPHGAVPGPRGEPWSHPCAPLCVAVPAPNPAPSEPLRTGARPGAVARPPQ